jgi:hypothetical protein
MREENGRPAKSKKARQGPLKAPSFPCRALVCNRRMAMTVDSTRELFVATTT